MTGCPACEGEGSHESGILCGGPGCSCDGYSGGCVTNTVCELCTGLCEISYEDAYEWAREQNRSLERVLAKVRAQLAA